MIDLRAGNLYNVVISLLVFLGCFYSAWAIFSRGKKNIPEKSFALFLSALGGYWLVVAAGNLLAWADLLSRVKIIAYLIKFTSVLPPLMLAYYFFTDIFESKRNVRRATFLYLIILGVYLISTIRLDSTQSMVTYWGVQWLVSRQPFLIYIFGILFPLGVAAIYSILRSIWIGILQKKTVSLTIYLGAIVFVLLEILQISVTVVTWPRLLARLFYILIAFGAYLFFIGRIEERRFISRNESPVLGRQPRIPFFAKLLFLYILLAVIPIIISSLLMFVSFRESIDLYIYKPLLWNLKTSREAFLMSLSHVQVQALFLMILTGLLVFLASILVSRAISESLRSISIGMKRVSSGDFSFKLRRDSNDEIGDVIDYFNEMSAEIKKSREIMERWSHELEVKVAERTEDLRILYNISKAIGSSLDLELLIGRAIDQLLPVLKAEVYALLTPDKNHKFSARISRGMNLIDLRIEERKGLLGEALRKNEIVFSENVSGDPRCQEDFYKNLGLKTLAVIPLSAKGKFLGVLFIGTRGMHRHSKERAINLLSTISDQLAIAIENVGIYEREKEAVARLTELDRMKNEFISMVSHELRTPVTSVDGYVSLLQTGTLGPITEDQKKYLTIVKENDQRLLNLIDRLLDFSSIESGRFAIKRELVSMHGVIQSAVRAVQWQIDKQKAELKLDLKAKNAKFMGDRERMEEVFMNLIRNALKFGREEGALKIEIKTQEAGDFIKVEVADNGIGIEKGNLGKIFNKFFQVADTLTRKTGGMGLGLAIVKEIIGKHNGKIWAESGGPGKGTRFIFTVPVAEKV